MQHQQEEELKPLKATTIGLNVLQVWTLIGLVIIGAFWVMFYYFEFKQGIKESRRVSEENNTMLKQMLSKQEENQKMNEMKMTNIDQSQRTLELRITILETQLKTITK